MIADNTAQRHEYEAIAAGEREHGSNGTVVFVVSTNALDEGRGDLFVALGLAKHLADLEWGVALWPMSRWAEGFPGSATIAIVMLESYVPGMVPADVPAIAWVRNWVDVWLDLPYLDQFDAIWASSPEAAAALVDRSGVPAEVVPLAVDHELFTERGGGRDVDVLTTANHWGRPRDLDVAVRAVALRRDVVWLGGGHEVGKRGGVDYAGFVSFFSLPDYYARAQIVIDDLIEPAKKYGNQNSRLFEALVAGALPITNVAAGLDVLGLEDVPSYSDPDELPPMVDRLLQDPAALESRRSGLREIVLARHTYAQRASSVDPWLRSLIEARAGAGRERPAMLRWSASERFKFIYVELQRDAAVREAERLGTVLQEANGSLDERAKEVESLQAVVSGLVERLERITTHPLFTIGDLLRRLAVSGRRRLGGR